ncbi:MAG: glycoside hydrolase family 2 TIM barrel-domain containing protein [Bryobacteraceae bacterium]|jgi:beta-glucuronidase
MSETRRRFLGTQILAGTAVLGPAIPATAGAAAPAAAAPPIDGLDVSLDGEWEFRTDGDTAWRTVTVPHTWQVMDGLEGYYGVAHYRRTFHAPPESANAEVCIEFESVFHTAEVKLNGSAVGEHRGKGYTAFRTDELSGALKPGADNLLEVRVDNSFTDAMLPRSHSSDWAHDGGIYRPVRLLVLPKAHLDRVHIDAWPDKGGVAQFSVNASFTSQGQEAVVELRIVEQETGLTVQLIITLRADETLGSLKGASFRGFWENARYWHFDHPHLYSLEATLVSANGSALHRVSRTFGVRKFEVQDGGFQLNGEPVRLMGVERMAGSNPDYGMAEPVDWIEHDHADMKNLNCVFTRVHWQQDRRLLDWCDRHGILVQLEVPTWGGGTFQNMTPELEKTLQQNGLDQLREMIAQNRDHPSVVAWGLCNEIDGQNPPAAQFARNMLAEARKLDPSRPCTYASNSLEKTPARDVSAFMDYVSWNQYYGSWSKGSPADMENNLVEILAAFPGKPLVISEYGYCACTPERPEGDEPRIRTLLDQNAVLRRHGRVAGLIFFCYNDYRTHIGDRGKGALKQRVHGVVDVYGRHKPSYEVLREESSPVETLTATLTGNELKVAGRTRASVPGYTLRGYTLEAVVYGQGNIPVERQRLPLPDLVPGSAIAHTFMLSAKDALEVRVDVRRATGWSATTAIARR